MSLKKNIPLRTERGIPLPFGPTFQDKGVNFSVSSKHATAVTLALFSPNSPTPDYTLPLDPLTNKTGDIWHIFVYDVPAHLNYGFYVDGPNDPPEGFLFNPKKLLADPYAKELSIDARWGTPPGEIRGVLNAPQPFDWQDDRYPNLPASDLIIYEMHVRGFTQHMSSGVTYPGTFLGLIEKIPHLKSLGVNAIELLPIHAFNECELHTKNPQTGQSLYNYWGYSTLNFFTPMARYATHHQESIKEFKMMVAALHKEGIEVILDVVFNHTSEGGTSGPTLSFRGFDNSIYYILGAQGEYFNFSGCGNTVNCNHPVVRELIHNSLRYWVTEMHVDGFRFDLASILTRGTDGRPLPSPPLLEAIALDPVFSRTKLIAEAWDAAGLYQVGAFPSWGVWAEWNGQYRDNIRRFIKGTPGETGNFATRLCGSADLYARDRQPYHSINFVTCHDGFSLADLVSYNSKHNQENGENDQDGSNDNESWNCGVEGDSEDKEILALRHRQMRNFIVALMVSQGVPMIHMGDEYGHTKKGNNNTWCQDNELNWFLWNQLEENQPLFQFFQQMIQFRHSHSLLKQATFLTPEAIEWHGTSPYHPDWRPSSQLIAYTLKDLNKGEDLYIAFNATNTQAKLTLPRCTEGHHWNRVVDTKHSSPDDFIKENEQTPLFSNHYTMGPFSSLILAAK